MSILKINPDLYVGDTGRQLKEIIKVHEQNINILDITSQQKWVKICNIKHAIHNQGEFSFIKIFIGAGNNGRTDQNAYIDLICQMGWENSDGGRYGCNAELHKFLTPFTTNNTKIKVLANSNTDYDIWFYCNEFYNRINYIVNTSKNTIVTTKGELSLIEPTGTECNLSYIGDKNSYNLVTEATPIKTGRKIDGKEEYVYRVNLGSLPNNSTKTYNLPFTIGKCYRVEGVAHRSTDGVDFPLPYVNPGAGMAFHIGIWTLQNKQLVVNTATDRSDLTGYVDIFFSY